jgi:hypothetical protein
MCENKLKLWYYLQADKHGVPRQNSRTEKHDKLFCEIPPITHSVLLVTDEVPGLNEAVHMVTTRFQHLLWPQLWCLILGNCIITGSFNILRSFQTPVTLYQSTRRNMRKICIFSKKAVRISILAYLEWPFKWCSRILMVSWRSATVLVHTTTFT